MLFFFNSTSSFGRGSEGVTHQRLDCTYFLTFDSFSSCLDPSYQTSWKNLWEKQQIHSSLTTATMNLATTVTLTAKTVTIHLEDFL